MFNPRWPKCLTARNLFRAEVASLFKFRKRDLLGLFFPGRHQLRAALPASGALRSSQPIPETSRRDEDRLTAGILAKDAQALKRLRPAEEPMGTHAI
jgi:hypothetical protein